MNKPLRVIGILGLTFLLAVCCTNEFLRFVLGFELLLFLFSFAELCYFQKKIRVALKLPDPTAVRGTSFQVGLQVENTSCIPIPELEASVVFRDLWDGRELVASGKIMLDGNEKGILQFSLDTQFCGALEISPYKVILEDHLGFFNRTCLVRSETRSISILPLYPEEALRALENGGSAVEGEGDQNRKGTSSLDVSDIRVYKPGDSLRYVHWKLSAKLSELMVRELSEPIEKNRKVYLNLYLAEDTFSREKWDAFLMRVCEVSLSFLQIGQRHVIIWFDGETGSIVHKKVIDGESMQEMLCMLLRAHPWRRQDIKEVLLEEVDRDEKEEKIEINLQGEVIRTGEEG